jgi:D-3-phosphoglycerate dehydrogenase
VDIHVAVASPSFGRHPVLRSELRDLAPGARFCPGEDVLRGPDLSLHLAGATVAIIGQERVDAALLEALPTLRTISKYGVGLDNIDLEACRARGIHVHWEPGVNARSVAELALALVLGHAHNVFLTSRRLREGHWWKRGGVLLSGRTVGILGLGHVGRDLVRLLIPFGCRLLGNDLLDRTEFAEAHGVELVGKDALFAEADVVSLHVPLTPLTRGLVGRDLLQSMREDALLVNTARGGIVDEAAVAEALDGGRLGGYAADVWEREPPGDLPLLRHEAVVGTPHIGGNSEEAVLAMGRAAIRGVAQALAQSRPGRQLHRRVAGDRLKPLEERP